MAFTCEQPPAIVHLQTTIGRADGTRLLDSTPRPGRRKTLMMPMSFLWRRPTFLALLVLTMVAFSSGYAQPPAFNERDVKKETNVQDKEGIWVLDFRFKDPRLITVDIPGRGRKVVWYLWYQVVNNTDQPRTF